MKTAILWFRRDLRLHDNAALNWVCENSASIIPVYIHSPDEEHPWTPGGASRWWLHHSLIALDEKLQSYGLKLHYFSGSSSKVIEQIIQKTSADSLVFNKLYEPHLYSRDVNLQNTLKETINITAFESGLFFSPGTVLNNQQLPYRVFTPFYKKIRSLLDPALRHYNVALPVKKLKKLKSVKIDFDQPLGKLHLLDSNRWHEKLHQYWQPGEDTTLNLADRFIDEPVEHYQLERDIPSVNGTSQLSSGLHFGEITPQQIYLDLLPLINGVDGVKAGQSAEVFLKQLIWREFAHNVMWHFPETTTQPMDRRYKKSFWRTNKKALLAWQRGETGIPIVDAGMKQLWETGWMHNRVRMIVGSLLTKNLGLSWTHGAHWFWDTLVDADLANNSMGWQWVAGCGVDAAPYYRVFNPLTQASRFDAGLRYVNKWVPEQGEANYRTPIVDLASSRNAALQRYKQIISS